MLVLGSSRTKRSLLLSEKYIELVREGVPAPEILVLVQNRHKKQLFIDRIKESLSVLENPQIYTFYGLVYNAMKWNWADVENSISFGESCIVPNLTGLEISQYLFKQCVKDTGFHDYNSKINLLHQLFRRYSLIVQNNLSDLEVKKRSEMLKESFADDAKSAIDKFKRLTLKYRTFDYIRQCAVFSHLYKTSDILKKFKYLIVDDLDEVTNAEFDFLEQLKPYLDGWYVGMDKYGVTRAGFLGGDFSIPKRAQKLFGDEIVELDNLKISSPAVVHQSYSKYIEMLKNSFEHAVSLIKEKNLSCNDVSVVVPEIGSAVKFFAAEIFGSKNIKYQVFSGSEKLSENKVIKNILNVLKLAHPAYEDSVNTLELRAICHCLLGIPIKDLLPVVLNYSDILKSDAVFFDNQDYNQKIQTLFEVVERFKNTEYSLSEQAEIVFEELVDTDDVQVLNKINFLIKQIRDFETVFSAKSTDLSFKKDIIIQLENTIISENPADAPVVEPEALCIATAQKIIDLEIKSKYQIWLDITNSVWTREDTGTIYNAWVFQPSWDKKEFTFDDNLILSTEKIKRQLRKLSLLSSEKIFAFSSLFDINGLENADGIVDFLEFKREKKEALSAFNFVPRDDQKPVLDYSGGKLAISAVPGAGKTTILLALVVKLIRQGVLPENIFVLTYMDSAARNFKERIKNICPDAEILPNISTIHGLALRILKENSNFMRVGLSSDFEVCDDNQRQKILRESISSLRLNHDDYDKYEKAISSLKLSGAKKIIQPKYPEIKDFLSLFNLYNKSLKSQNLVDYDDMLRLAVALLEKNSDIKEHYQRLCLFIIEDEAQDSSIVQQNLLNILSDRHGNLIRCGDINQSITTTFTNADIKGFRDFVEKNDCVKMECSQRCSKEIYTLANRLVECAKTLPDGKNAFYDTFMRPVEGKNPIAPNSVVEKLFDDFNDERNYIVSKIREIYRKNKKADIAILLRSNFQIDEYSHFLANAGFDVVTRSDSLERQPAFRLILGLLKFVRSPWDNSNVLNVIDVLVEQRLVSISAQDRQFVSEMKSPFISFDADAFESEVLTQLHWDLNYWLEASELAPDEFAFKVGEYYYNSDVEISNVYMISIFIKKLSNQYKLELVEKLEELSKKASAGKFRLFSETDENMENESGKILLMTYHKSKGDEFDYVFIPQLCEEVLPMSAENVKIKSQDRFMESVKALNPEYSLKNEQQLKLNIIEENLRLLYVAITRAKLGLFLTCARKYKKFSKIKDYNQSVFFEMIASDSVKKYSTQNEKNELLVSPPLSAQKTDKNPYKKGVYSV